MSSPTRVYPGYYRWTLPTTVDGQPALARFEIRYMSEWDDPCKWQVTAEYDVMDYTRELVAPTDIICHTYRDAKESASTAAAHGFQATRFGYCAAFSLDAVKRKG